MRQVFIAAILFLSQLAVAQTREIDSLELNKTMDWLQRKLSYTYYNPVDKEWWINDFTYNPKTKVVLIKNTATDRLGKPGGKTYLQRSYKPNDMNAYSIAIEPIVENAGRMVVGSSIRLGVYNHERKVDQYKNGLSASPQSSLYFSIPTAFEDSVKGFGLEVTNQLQKSIQLATRVYPSSNPKNQLISLLEGKFSSEDRSWEVSRLFDLTIEIDETIKEVRQRKLIIKFETQSASLTILSASGTSAPVGLSYDKKTVGLSGESFVLSFENKNEIKLSNGSGSVVLIRDWGFENSPQYR